LISVAPDKKQHRMHLWKKTCVDLVADIEKLTSILENRKWQVFGGSWGKRPSLAMR
jgi:hypothetical protein